MWDTAFAGKGRTGQLAIAGRPTVGSSLNGGIGGLLHERAEVHHLVRHRWFLESGWCQQPDPTDESSMPTAKPSARYGAMWGRACGRLALPTISWDTTLRERTNSPGCRLRFTKGAPYAPG